MFLFGSMGIFARLSAQNGLIIAAVASFVSALFMLIVLFLKNQLDFIWKRNIWLLFFIGFFGAANNSLYFYAFSLTKISNAVFLHYFAPIFVLFLSWICFRDKMTIENFIAILIASFGLVLIIGKPNLFTLRISGDLFALGSALAYAASLITYKKAMKYFNIMQIIFVQMLFTAIVFLPFLVSKLDTIPITSWVYLVIIGFVHQFIAVIFHLKGLSRIKVTTVAILGYTEPFFALILSWIFLSEKISLISFLGGMMIMTASYLVVRK
jgi:drug/metabolite transporter (DMT)-like permease